MTVGLSYAEARALFRQHLIELPARGASADEDLVPLADEFRDAFAAMARGSDPEGDGSGARYDTILHRIIGQPAEGKVGLIAKARLMTLLEEQRDYEAAADLGWSIARDLLRIGGAQ